MGARKFLSIRSNDVHYILLFIISIVLVVWQYFGMSRYQVVAPGVSTGLPATLFSDFINGGRSKSQLTNEADKIILDCNIVLSDTFAFCGVSIPLMGEGDKAIDMRKYSRMQIELEYVSAQKDTLLVYLVNEEVLDDGSKLEKSNLWAVSPDQGINYFSLAPDRFIMPSWWVYQNSRKGLNLEPDISNVTALRITTGDNTSARDVRIRIRHIAFSGKWISAEDLYLGLLVTWLALFSLHGLLYIRALTEHFKQSKQHNEKLVNLNRFLSIQKNQYEAMAKKDELTGAWNRAGVRDVLEYVLEEFKLNAAPCSLLAFDVDNFKNINDDFGHDVGDRVLKALAALIIAHTRDNDYLARWGGDEFVLICPNTGLRDAEVLAGKLRHIIETAQLITERRITSSIGVAELGDEEIEQWFKRADIALYHAKEAGRDFIECA